LVRHFTKALPIRTLRPPAALSRTMECAPAWGKDCGSGDLLYLPQVAGTCRSESVSALVSASARSVYDRALHSTTQAAELAAATDANAAVLSSRCASVGARYSPSCSRR
jgi:hypothetical protein